MSRLVEMWACSHCGPHPDSSAEWCAKGCGRDYNRMYLAAAHGSTEYWQQVAEVVTDDLRASKASVAALTAENAALREAVFEAIQSLEEWGASDELAPGIARWRALAAPLLRRLDAAASREATP